MFVYCRNNPILFVDLTGHSAALGVLIAGGVGFIAGVTSQFVSDLTTSAITGSWQFSSWETYVGAGVGGAAGGVTAMFLDPTTSAAVGSWTSTFVGQTLESLTGRNARPAGEILYNSTIDAALGVFFNDVLPPIKIKGVTTGRNSNNSVFKSGLTKLKNGTASKMSFRVIIKGTTANVVEDVVPSIANGMAKIGEQFRLGGMCH